MDLIKDFQKEIKRYAKEEQFCNKAAILINKYVDIFSDLEVKCSMQFTRDLSIVFVLKTKKSKIYIEQYFNEDIDNFDNEIYITTANKNIYFYGCARLETLEYELKEILKN